MGVELSAFLLFMTEKEAAGAGSYAYEVVGHYTKDENELLRFLSNLFAINGDRNLVCMRPQA